MEGVLMRNKYGLSLCISTQVGCRMGCRFCASTLEGKVRDMTAGEMLGEILAANRFLEGNGTADKVSHVVLMGSGETLDNYDEVIRFLRLLREEDGIRISLRNVSLSTCGITERFDDLAARDLQLTLSVSLHAPDDELRKELMPIARSYALPDLIAACRRYTETTHRRITFEYSLFAGKNDSEAHAKALAKLISGMLCNVNLIAANEFPGSDYRRSSKDYVRRFQQTLEAAGINATLRREMGTDIMAACGQLRRSVEEGRS